MKVLMYGIESCKSCKTAKERLDEANVEYKYLSFTDSIMNLRRFLEYRDKEPMFDEVKKEGRVGIPLFYLEDGTLTFSLDEVIEKAGK